MKFEIEINEALGNLNKLPAGYKRLVRYTLKNIDTRWIGASENSEIEMLENVTGDKLAATLRKATASKEKKIGFFIVANDNGYKLYIPQADKISATAEFYIAAQEMPPSYELNVGPGQPTFSITSGTGRNSSWKPIRLRDILSLEAGVTYSLYVVYQDPVAVEKERKRNEWDSNPDLLATDGRGNSLTMRRIKAALPTYKASKAEAVDFSTLTVPKLYNLLQSAPTSNEWSDAVRMVVKGIDGVCEYRGAKWFSMTRDGVYVGNLRTESGSSKSVYVTTKGFVLE